MRSSESFLKPRDLMRRQHADIGVRGEPLLQCGAQPRRRFAEDKFAGGFRHQVGMQGLAASIIEHARVRRRHQRGDLFGDQPVMNVLVPGIDVNEMPAVKERKPIGDRSPHGVGS